VARIASSRRTRVSEKPGPKDPSGANPVWLALDDNRPVRLDLSAVTFIDRRGVAVLRHLGANELEVIDCPEFIGEMLRTP